ncbi:MAG: esterase-like activity of phytase family protein [Cyanobacteria bacterium J06650_10]
MSQVRFASFNSFLNRSNEGELIENLSTPDDVQAQAVGEVLQRNRPDVVLLNEFDFDDEGTAIDLFQQNYLSVAQAEGIDPIEYPYVYSAPSNTGVAAGLDFNNDGEIATEVGDDGYGDDSFGFGFFPGQFAQVLLSKYPIVEEDVRTFQTFLWKDMPGALLPEDPEDADGNGDTENWYTEEELAAFRLSSKSHWDVPIEVDGEVIHVLASHPTPPVFDGAEDRNGRRNYDEIRFWADYVTPGEGEYIYDDEGSTGGLTPGDRFVIMGDQNADPYEGGSIPGAIQQLLNNPNINISQQPQSAGGIDAAVRQGSNNIGQLSDPAFDTADFGEAEFGGPGNLRADYVLPSSNLEIVDTGIFWPASGEPQFALVGEGFPVVSSDHRLVYADVQPFDLPADMRKTVTGVDFLGQAVFETGFKFADTEVGGLSGMAYDSAKDLYYALSDDRGNRSGPIPEAGSLSDYIGFVDGSYFIEVPDDEINDFFAWEESYPDLVSAHRGGFATGFPENAIETFENTLTLGPALLEVDVQRTSDGEWILMHDDTLDRTTTGTGLVTETTLAEIQALNLVDNEGNVTDFKVPTLQEALTWAEGRTILELDIKTDEFHEEVVQIISDLDAEDQARFITQDLDQATGVHNLNPEIHLGLFITSENQAEVLSGVEAAPFTTENISAFTGTRPEGKDFYSSLHEQGIVAIQGLFGNQDVAGESTFINDLTDEQRLELFETVYERGGDAIASDFSEPIIDLLDYAQSPLPRYYSLNIDLTDSSLEDGDVTFTDVTSLTDIDGEPFIPGELDPEGIALNSTGTLYVSSEGDANNLVAPFVNEVSLSGQAIRSLPVPDKYLPTEDNTSGIRNNQAFESLTLTPDQRTLYTATENALNQDGPRASLEEQSPVRILSYDLTTGEPAAEYLYETDVIPTTPVPADSFADNGLVELLAIDNNGTLLALERSFAIGVGNNLRLYEVQVQDASDISDLDSIADNDQVSPVEKRLLLDFDELGIQLDNSEALTFGPTLPDGRQSLIVTSDNNFNRGGGFTADPQITQFLAFALDIEAEGSRNIVQGSDASERLIDSSAGDDLFFGGGGDDVIMGDRLRLNGAPNPGDSDTINGEDGNDILRGRGGDDLLFGGEGNDKLLGEAGDDILNGGVGSDIFNGGAGSDTFVLTAGEGTDIIRDFVAGTDVIGLTSNLSFGSLTFSHRTITFENDVLARFTGVDATTLTADNFVAV